MDLNGQHVVSFHQPIPRIEDHLLRHTALIQLRFMESVGPRVERNGMLEQGLRTRHGLGTEHLMAVEKGHAAVIVVEGQQAVHQA